MIEASVVQPLDSAQRRPPREFVRELGHLAVVSRAVLAYNVAYFALVWASALGSIALFWVLPSPFTFLLAFLVVSSRHQALLNCEHECIHGKFVRGRRGNGLIGRWLCAAPAGSPYGASLARHLAHHRLVGTTEDPDRELYDGPAQRTKGGLTRHFLGGLVGGYAGMVLLGPPTSASAGSAASRAKDFASLVVAQGTLLIGLTLTTAWWVYPALWIAPLITVTVLMHLVRSFVEHAVTGAEMPEHANRLITIRSNLVERGMLSPYFMNYHAEHHLQPAVPAPRLRQLSRRLSGREDVPTILVRRSYGSALRHLWREL